MGNRDTGAAINIAAAWDNSDDDEVNIEWARTAWDDIRPFSTGRTYINFLTQDESEDRLLDAYGSNLSRLAELKAAWDPDNLFRANKNIRPAMSTV